MGVVQSGHAEMAVQPEQNVSVFRDLFCYLNFLSLQRLCFQFVSECEYDSNFEKVFELDIRHITVILQYYKKFINNIEVYISYQY